MKAENKQHRREDIAEKVRKGVNAEMGNVKLLLREKQITKGKKRKRTQVRVRKN